MRDIKFRGRRLDNGKWVYGYYIHRSNRYQLSPEIYVESNNLDFEDESHPVDARTVGQFTGIQDKNGKDVFEGDIVKAHYHYFNGNFDNDGEIIGEIIYSEWCTFGIGNSKNPDHGWMEIDDTTHFEEPCIEIIGDIYTTPELLEQ